MAVFLAYLSVVLIWATTPLAIKWSSDSLSFIAAATGRTLLALPLALVIGWLFARPLQLARHWKIYGAASLTIFPNMPIIYWSAKFIPSGLMAVLFSLTPFFTGVMSFWLLKENPFSPRRVIALLIAIAGLTVIFAHQFSLEKNAGLGVLGVIVSGLLFSLSSVMVKKITYLGGEQPAGAFNQATGSLLLALPGLLLVWLIADGQIPHTISQKSGGSLVYLAIIGSLLGAGLFFYILRHLSATSVSMVTLITPVLALTLGALIAQEQLSASGYLGVALVLLGLLIYTGLPLRRWLERVDTSLLQKMLRSSYGPDEELIRELEAIRRDTFRHK